MVYIAILGLLMLLCSIPFPNSHAPSLEINDCYLTTEFRNLMKLCFQESSCQFWAWLMQMQKDKWRTRCEECKFNRLTSFLKVRNNLNCKSSNLNCKSSGYQLTIIWNNIQKLMVQGLLDVHLLSVIERLCGNVADQWLANN